jgi:type IV secretory pathway protease TraF
MAQSWRSPKDPEEVKDYIMDHSAALEDDETIVTSSWVIAGDDSVLVENSNEIDDETRAVIWLSGGTLNATYLLTNTVTTSDGRTFELTGRLKVKAK